MAPTTTPSPDHTAPPRPFANNRQVTIKGYGGNAEEPYLTPDNKYLVFDDRSNGTNIPKIHYAKRVNDTTFSYAGEVAGVNSPASPSISVSIDDANNFYFNSPRAPDPNYCTYRGVWHNGRVTNIALVPGLAPTSRQTSKAVGNVSRDGQTLYLFYVVNAVSRVGIALANQDGGFTELDHDSTDPRFIAWKKDVWNIYESSFGTSQPTIQSGPYMTTPDGTEAYFEQINMDTGKWPPNLNRIYVAKRRSTAEPFGTPEVVTGQATLPDGTMGFNEAAFVSRNGRLLYYHYIDLVQGQDPHNATFSLYVMSR